MNLVTETHNYVIVVVEEKTGQILNGPVNRRFTLPRVESRRKTVEENVLALAINMYKQELSALRYTEGYEWLTQKLWHVACREDDSVTV